MINAIHTLMARRHQHFAEDPRAVGEWSIAIDSSGSIRLHCDAHAPPSPVASILTNLSIMSVINLQERP